MTSPFKLEEFLPFVLFQAAEDVSQGFSKIYRREYGMTRPEWRVLAHLGEYGPMTSKQIGAAAGLHKTKVSRAVFALEKRRWLTRETMSDDRRLQMLTLTTTGKKNYAQLAKFADTYNRELIERLGAEKFRQSLSVLKNLKDAE